ncbi:MAG: IclR family transcriptional regulator [Magnetospirillum sp.]
MKKRVNHKSGEGLETAQDFASDRQFVVALHRGLEVLRCFRPGECLDDREIARRLDIPKATLARLTATLAAQDCLRRDDDGKYRLGLGLLALGYGNLGGINICGAIQPFMDELAAYAGEGIMVALGGEDELSMVYWACTRNAGMVTLQTHVGSRISLARTSMGQAYLAGLDDDRRAALLARLRHKAGADSWPTIEANIGQSLAQVRQTGFCCNYGNWRSDVHSVGVPFSLKNSTLPPLAFNCGGPAYLLSRQRLEDDLGPRLVAMVSRLKSVCDGQSPLAVSAESGLRTTADSFRGSKS